MKLVPFIREELFSILVGGTSLFNAILYFINGNTSAGIGWACVVAMVAVKRYEDGKYREKIFFQQEQLEHYESYRVRSTRDKNTI